MTTQEYKDLFMKYYDEAVESKDPEKMQILGSVLKQLYNKTAEMHPDLAQKMLDVMMAISYHNYVTASEATEIASHFVNDDAMVSGSAEHPKGAHWSMDQAKNFLTAHNIPLEDEPYYNWPALWLTMNMIYSDYADVIAEAVGKDSEKIATTCYKMAVKKLKDLDRPHFLREYFELD